MKINNLHFKSLKFKMILAFLLLSLTVVGVLWAYQQFFLAKNYQKSQEIWLKSQVRELANQVNQGNTAQAQMLFDTVFVDGGASVEWYDAQGNLIDASLTFDKKGSNGKMGMGHNFLVAPRLLLSEFGKEFTEKGSVLARGPFSRVNTELIVYALRLDSGGLVLATLPITAIDAAVNLMQGELLWLSILIGAISMLIGAVMATQMTKPVALLESSVKQMATGDFTVRVAEEGSQEFISLARSVNQMAEALGRLDRLKDELIANVSHELRTPLGIIKGYAEMLVDIEDLSAADKRRHLMSISEEATQLGDLVHALLDVSQMRAGTMALASEPIDLYAFVQEVSERFHMIAQSQGVHLQVSQVSASAWADKVIYSDALRLKQILKNLLDNAIKFTPAGGRVDIVVDGNLIVIKDTGIGISQMEIDKIWDRHYQSIPSLKGSGIGLALVKSLCELLKIQVAIDSEVDKGTKITLSLDCVEKIQ